MELGKRQELFSRLIAELILHIYEVGFQVRCGDFQAFAVDKRHKVGSLHYVRCAADLNLFKDGKFLTTEADHKPFAIYWEAMHPNCRNGWRYGDANHYELLAEPRAVGKEG